jgi:IS5 family transposase
VGIDLGHEPVPDETTILNFRHLLERHKLGEALFKRVNDYLALRGMKVAGGTIVDASIIAAPDPEMHQTRKGQQWYFGMKLHVGVDSKSKLIHSMTTTAANVHDATVLGELLHGSETRVYGDQAFQGQGAMIREHAPNAKDFTNRRWRYRGVVDAVQRGKNRTKSRVRAKVEHSGVIKRVFGYAKVRYRGLAKNRQRLWLSCGLVNLFIVRRRLLRT